MSDRQDLLARVPLFEKLPKKTLDRLSKLMVERGFAAGAEIVREGEGAGAFFLVTSGVAEVQHGGSVLRTLAEGEHFGEMALLDGQPRSATVRAQDAVTCLALVRWDFLAEIRTNPELALGLLESLSLRLRALEPDPLRLQTLHGTAVAQTES